MARISDIADDVVSALAEEYGAELTYSPVFEMRSLAGKRCVVVPVGETVENASRGASRRTFEIHVCLVRKGADDEAIRAFVEDTERLGDDIRRMRSNGAMCISVKYDPLYSVDEIRRSNLLVSVVMARFVEIA